MNMKKKLLIIAGSAVGAVAILAQAVWADGKNTISTSNASTQITAEEHAAHHPATAPAVANTTVENKATADEMMPMGDGNMTDMMKMMGEGNMADMMKMMGEGNMADMMKMMGEGNMADMMKMMGEGNMADMMKMMETPEGKALMEKCQELLKQQPAAAVEG